MRMAMRRLFSIIVTSVMLLLSVRFAYAQALTGSDTIGFNPKFTATTSTSNSITRKSGSGLAAGPAPLAGWRFYESSSSKFGGAAKAADVTGRGLFAPRNLAAAGSLLRLTPNAAGGTAGTLMNISHAVQWSGTVRCDDA